MELKQAFWYSFWIFIASVIPVLLLQSQIINWYFDSQPVVTIDESKAITQRDGYGKVIVINGNIDYVSDSYIIFSDNISNKVIEMYLTDKLNCIPVQGTTKKIAGAWNPDHPNSTDKFYGIWIVDGCD